jgi:isopentenyl diphosphate isomerase/L-lactate dehydrogenase-like FMN-dependent dehydrogenase
MSSLGGDCDAARRLSGLAGADGVKRVIDILGQEFEMAMVLTGVGSIREIDASVLWDGIPR